MKRRQFITLFGAAAAAWPIAARSQQQNRQRLVGLALTFSEAEISPAIAAFRSRLAQSGWREGGNLALDVRIAAGDYQRMTAEAGVLVSKNPDVIIAQGTPGVTAVRKHSDRVPVVFTMVADPVRTGIVESLARPGGHTTGFTNFEFSIGAKWLELLREVSPQLTHVTSMANPANPTASPLARVIEDSARSNSIEATTAFVRSESDLETVITSTAQRAGGGLIVLPDGFSVAHAELIVNLARRHLLPAIYPFRSFANRGGLITYGLDTPEMFRQAAEYVDRILRGATPSELPVQAPNKFELVINLKTAKALGLTVPTTLQVAADEVID